MQSLYFIILNMAGESQPQPTQSNLREIYDGTYLSLVEASTGKSADEIRAMSFEDRRAVLATVGVNLKDLKEEDQQSTPRTTYHLG